MNKHLNFRRFSTNNGSAKTSCFTRKFWRGKTNLQIKFHIRVASQPSVKEAGRLNSRYLLIYLLYLKTLPVPVSIDYGIEVICGSGLDC